MMRETGMTRQAVLERSSILQMENLRCPVLILHGEKDLNVPVNQARLLEQELLRLGKEFEIEIVPDRAHDIGDCAQPLAISFLRDRLCQPSSVTIPAPRGP